MDDGHQGLDTFGLSLVDGGKVSDLCPECGDLLLQGDEAGCYRRLYLNQGVLQIIVIVI